MPTPPTPASSREVSADQTSKKRFEDDPRWILKCLLGALKPLSDLRRSIPLPYVTVFLTVALDEGKGVGAYARDLGIHRWTMSRYLRDIGERARSGAPGLCLVTVEHYSDDPRQTQVLLTAKGRAVAEEVFRQMSRLATR